MASIMIICSVEILMAAQRAINSGINVVSSANDWPKLSAQVTMAAGARSSALSQAAAHGSIMSHHQHQHQHHQHLLLYHHHRRPYKHTSTAASMRIKCDADAGDDDSDSEFSAMVRDFMEAEVGGDAGRRSALSCVIVGDIARSAAARPRYPCTNQAEAALRVRRSF
jgi:hypothetical protein